MTTMTATKLRRNIFEVLNNTAKYNDMVNVTTKEGSVVIMSEAYYRGLMETVYLYSQPGLVEKILNVNAAPVDEGVNAVEVDW